MEIKATKGDIFWTVAFFVLCAIIAFFPWPAQATEVLINGTVRIYYNGSVYSWNGTVYRALSSTIGNTPSDVTMMYNLRTKYPDTTIPPKPNGRVPKPNDYSEWVLNLGTEAGGGVNHSARAHCYGGLFYGYEVSYVTVTAALHCDRIDGDIL